MQKHYEFRLGRTMGICSYLINCDAKLIVFLRDKYKIVATEFVVATEHIMLGPFNNIPEALCYRI